MASKMRGLIVQDDHSVAVGQADKPTPTGKDILIKVSAIALNAGDPKVAAMVPAGSGIGSDAVGVVEAIGPDVPAGAVQIGERRAGWMLAFDGRGSFAEYAAYPYDLTWAVPDNVSDADAATTPIPLFTAIQILFVRFGLVAPAVDKLRAPTRDDWLFVYGASSAVGVFTVQLAKMLGFKVVATASPHNFSLLSSLGADAIISYKDADWVDQVKRVTDTSLAFAVDCIAEPDTIAHVVQTLGSKGGKVACTVPFLQGSFDRADVEVMPTFMGTMDGQDHQMGPALVKAHPQDYATAVDWCQRISWLAQHGRLRYPKTEDGGSFENANAGFERLKAGKVSGCKLVYRP